MFIQNKKSDYYAQMLWLLRKVKMSLKRIKFVKSKDKVNFWHNWNNEESRMWLQNFVLPRSVCIICSWHSHFASVFSEYVTFRTWNCRYPAPKLTKKKKSLHCKSPFRHQGSPHRSCCPTCLRHMQPGTPHLTPQAHPPSDRNWN